MIFPKLTSSTFPGNVDFQMSSKWRPQFLIDNFENVYLEQISIGLIVLFPMLEGTDDVSKAGVLDLSRKCRFSMLSKMATSISYR